MDVFYKVKKDSEKYSKLGSTENGFEVSEKHPYYGAGYDIAGKDKYTDKDDILWYLKEIMRKNISLHNRNIEILLVNRYSNVADLYKEGLFGFRQAKRIKSGACVEIDLWMKTIGEPVSGVVNISVENGIEVAVFNENK